MNHGLKSVMVERVHAYFTASPYFPDDMDKAFEDGKKRLVSTLQSQIDATEALDLKDYCRVTGANLGEG